MKSDETKTEAIIEKGRIYFNTGDLKLSKECFEKVLKLKLDDNKLGDISGYYAALLTRTGNIENAILYNRKALEYYKKTKNRTGEAHINANIGVIFLNTGRFKEATEAKKNYNLSLDIWKKLKNRKWEEQIYSNLGAMCVGVGLLEEAELYLNQALSIANEIGDKEYEARSKLNLVFKDES